jgi:hypothetical protein
MKDLVASLVFLFVFKGAISSFLWNTVVIGQGGHNHHKDFRSNRLFPESLHHNSHIAS